MQNVSGHVAVEHHIQYGGVNPSGVQAETGYGTMLRKGATVQLHRSGELAMDRHGVDQAKYGCGLQ